MAWKYGEVYWMHLIGTVICSNWNDYIISNGICSGLGMKTVRIFSDRIRYRIRLEGLRSIRIRVRISNIRYRIRIRILKSYIYDVDIQSYPIRHSWHYPYSNPNPDRNMKTNITSVISVRIRSVFIPTQDKINKSAAQVYGYICWKDHNSSKTLTVWSINFICQVVCYQVHILYG